MYCVFFIVGELSHGCLMVDAHGKTAGFVGRNLLSAPVVQPGAIDFRKTPRRQARSLGPFVAGTMVVEHHAVAVFGRAAHGNHVELEPEDGYRCERG